MCTEAATYVEDSQNHQALYELEDEKLRQQRREGVNEDNNATNNAEVEEPESEEAEEEVWKRCVECSKVTGYVQTKYMYRPHRTAPHNISVVMAIVESPTDSL